MINRKGQALIESLAVLALAGVLMLIFMQYGLKSIHDVALSEIMENRLLCELEDAPDCEAIMTAELNKLRFRTESVTLNKTELFIHLKLTGQLFEYFSLQRSLERVSFNEKF